MVFELKKLLKTDELVTKELVQSWLTKFSEKVDDQAEKLAYDMSMHIEKLQGRITALENILREQLEEKFKPKEEVVKKKLGRPIGKKGPYKKRK